MMRWLRKFLGLCGHKWEVLNVVRHSICDGHLYTMYHCQCEKCGKVKGMKVK